MTRPDWCAEATWAAASAFVRKDVRVQNDELRTIVAEAMMSARAVQREEDAGIAERIGATDWHEQAGEWIEVPRRIAAAIRNGGK